MPPRYSIRLLPAAVLLLLMGAGCSRLGLKDAGTSSPAAAANGQKSGKPRASSKGKSKGGKTAKTTGALDTTSPILPDRTKTPGDTLPVNSADVCTVGYAGKVRDVPQSVKNAVYQAYGITHRKPGQYEIDHLISLELGGSNSQKNLWPQSFETQPWNARVKDKLENELHDEICDGTITLAQAQKEVREDWIASYKKHFHTDLPLQTKTKRRHGGTPPPDAAADEDETPDNADAVTAPAKSSDVWVNLNSGVYWQPGTRYYGKTSKGKYESEAAAKKEGYRAAKD